MGAGSGWIWMVAAMVACSGAAPKLAEASECDSSAGPRSRIPAAWTRPEPASLLACSVTEPICVHWLHRAGPSPNPVAGYLGEPSEEVTGVLERALGSAEQILEIYRALDLPPLPSDAGRGGSCDFDLYLDPTAPAALTPVELPDPLSATDHAASYAIIPTPAADATCAFESQLARVLAEAILLGLDPAIHHGILALQASHLASLAAPCRTTELAAIDEFQRRPEQPITAATCGGLSGSMLFAQYLDSHHGTGMPGGVMMGLIAVSGQRTARQTTHWHNEPDVFDTLRQATQERGLAPGQLLLDFAVARAFVGSRSDGGHIPDVERFGDAGRVRFEWAIGFESLPRRLGPLRPIHPSGASFLWLDLRSAPPGSQLRFLAEWRAPVLFRWALVKVDEQGQETGRLEPPGILGSDRVHLTVADLDGLAGLIIVGVNVESSDPEHPFDPDDGPTMPALYAVTLRSS